MELRISAAKVSQLILMIKPTHRAITESKSIMLIIIRNTRPVLF